MNADFLISVVPQTADWSAKTASVMIMSNVACILQGVTLYKLKDKGLLYLGLCLHLVLIYPNLLATTSLGHIIGAGAILRSWLSRRISIKNIP